MGGRGGQIGSSGRAFGDCMACGMSRRTSYSNPTTSSSIAALLLPPPMLPSVRSTLAPITGYPIGVVTLPLFAHSIPRLSTLFRAPSSKFRPKLTAPRSKVERRIPVTFTMG